MKKVGIMTFHNAMSYGAVLQSYALQKTISGLGNDVEVIDYMCEDIYNCHVRILPKTKNIKFNIKMLLMGRKRYLWRKYLRNFRHEYLVESEKADRDNLPEIGKKYDIVVAGSDQVFNDVCTKFDETYFLDFVPDEKKYSYAASFGFNELPKEREADYKRRLEGFQELSIREESGCNIVRNLLGRDSRCNIDPTFLLNREEWDKVVVSKSRKPYILVFSVLKPLKMVDYAIQLGKEKNLDVLYLENYSFPPKKGLKYIGPVGPAEFIGLIKNAEYVVTNSFHGMAFSIIFQKKFGIELNTSASRNVRSENLLKKMDLLSTEIVDGKLDIDNVNPDWEHVKNYIKSEQSKSFDYLKGICE